MSRVCDLVAYVVRSLVEDHASVAVRETEGDRTVVLEIQVAPGDRGHVIGRRGATVRALRELAQAAAGKRGWRAVVEIVD